MNEIWLPIQGFENLYEISNLGRVKSLKKNGKKADCIMKPVINPRTKYWQTRLWNKGKVKDKTYHRLVAIHFIPNPDNLPEVNHIDGNKSNNCITNLEWCTKSQNKIHAVKLGLWKMTDSHKQSIRDYNKKLKSKPVNQYDKNGNFIAEYSSTEEAAIAVGGFQSNIVNCCNRKNCKSVKGFIFKYK